MGRGETFITLVVQRTRFSRSGPLGSVLHSCLEFKERHGFKVQLRNISQDSFKRLVKRLVPENHISPGVPLQAGPNNQMDHEMRLGPCDVVVSRQNTKPFVAIEKLLGRQGITLRFQWAPNSLKMILQTCLNPLPLQARDGLEPRDSHPLIHKNTRSPNVGQNCIFEFRCWTTAK